MIRYWRIEGYDSLTKIYDQEVEVSCFSEKQIRALLMALAAKTGLGFTEIVGAYARRRSRIANDFLSVRKEGRPYPVFSCGDNPHFVARVVAVHERKP